MQTFDPLPPRETAVAACARRLRTAILDGEIAPGSRLPPERALAERFGVNRVTVRSALAQLEAANLLSVRQGSGYVVRDYKREGGPELLVPLGALALEHGDLGPIAADLLRVRRHLAQAVFERLCDGVMPHDQAAFAAAVDAFSKATTAEVPEADLRVTAALVGATRSPVLQLCMNPVMAVVRGLPALRDAIYRDPAANLAGWRIVQSWLARPDRAALPLLAAELERRDAATLALLGVRP